MTWKKRLGISTGLVGATILTTILVHAQQPAGRRAPPAPPPAARAAEGARSPQAARDHGKFVIEQPTEALLASSAGGRDNGTGLPKERAALVNPKVAPGKVRWHKDFASACAAAAKSGKPVLLFHMMGRLDDKFC
jgi:hypothetical protein